MNVTKGSTMKKMLLTGTMILALAGAGLQSARAGDREWATAGRVLTGVVSDGFNTIVFPAASAGAHFHTAIIIG